MDGPTVDDCIGEGGHPLISLSTQRVESLSPEGIGMLFSCWFKHKAVE